LCFHKRRRRRMELAFSSSIYVEMFTHNPTASRERHPWAWFSFDPPSVMALCIFNWPNLQLIQVSGSSWLPGLQNESWWEQPMVRPQLNHMVLSIQMNPIMHSFGIQTCIPFPSFSILLEEIRKKVGYERTLMIDSTWHQQFIITDVPCVPAWFTRQQLIIRYMSICYKPRQVMQLMNTEI
jgi:hypothetical protein